MIIDLSRTSGVKLRSTRIALSVIYLQLMTERVQLKPNVFSDGLGGFRLDFVCLPPKEY